MNKVILIGNLTSDPTAKMTQDGTKMCTFRIAVNDYVGGKEQATFLHIVTFNKTAENCEKYLAKGRKVAVDGRISISSYEAQDGSKRYSTDIIANKVEFLGGKDGDAPKQEQPSAPSGIPEGFEELDSELPF